MSAPTESQSPIELGSFGLSRLAWVGCLVVVGIVWFVSLDARHLLRSDEGRYAEIAREMFSSGDWVTIRYQALKYFEKPPFQIWMTAICYEVFGVGDWQARVWVAISGAVGIAATAAAAKRWFGDRAACLAGVVLLAAPSWNIASHFNSLDMGVSGALACVMAGVLMAQHPLTKPNSRANWMIFSWVSMAIAVLTKGLIGIVLPGLVLAVYSATSSDWKVWRQLNLTLGLLWFLVVTAPWFVLVSIRNPEFPHFFFIHEHWERYTSSVHLRDAPFWYFLPQVLLGFLPWLGMSLGVSASVKAERARAGFRPLWFAASWAATVLVFFSLSSSKLPGYILPVFPALAFMTAAVLDKTSVIGWRRQLIGMLAVAVLGLAASAVAMRFNISGRNGQPYHLYVPWIAGAFAVTVFGLAVAWAFNRRSTPFRSMVTASLAFFLAITVATIGHESLGRPASGVDLVPKINAVLSADMPFYSVGTLDHTLPFYLRRTMIMVESPDELAFGTQQEPEKWLPTRAMFLTRWTSGERALALMLHDTYDELRDQHVPMTVVAEDARRVVVANFPISAP